LIVHLIVAPGAGVTVNVLVCVTPGQVEELAAETQSMTLIFVLSEQELPQPFVSVTERFTVTLPVIFGMTTLTVCELLPTGEGPPPL
jgi:hypothetical protein